MARCEQCGLAFEPKHPRHARYCSRRCANARGLAKPVRGIPSRPCRQCGVMFKPHHRGQPGLFCSRTCAGLGKTKPIPVRHCRHCGGTFQKAGEQQFCSHRCANRRRGADRLALNVGPPAWKQRHREFSRDYKLVQNANTRGELTLPDDWHVTHPEVQSWILSRRSEIEGEHEHARQYAARSGWPAELGPRRVQILNLLAHVGVPIRVKVMATTLGIRRDSVCKQLERLIGEGWVIGLGPSRSQGFTLGPTALSRQQELAQCQSCKPIE